MVEQQWWNDKSYTKKKEKILWIGSSDIHRFSRTSTHLCPINEKLRDGLQNAQQRQAEQEMKRPPNSIRRSRNASKRENHLQLTAVEGATCSLQERSSTQERFFSMTRFNLCQKIAVTAGETESGEFSPTYHSGVQLFTPDRLNGTSTEPNNQRVAQAPSLLNQQLLAHVQKSETNILHLYLPTAELYEEDKSDTARNKKQVPEIDGTRISKNIWKVDPRKPLPLHPSRRVIDKWTQGPSKKALTTAKLSIQFDGDSKGLHSSSSRRFLLDNTKNRFSLSEDTIHRNYIQRPASNVGYRLWPYYTYMIAENSVYGLNVRSLNLTNDKSKGTSLSIQSRDLEKGESFVRNTREHAMIGKPNVRCKSQADIIAVRERGAYI